MRRRRGGSSISFKFLWPPKIAATASRQSPITHALRAITKSAKRGAKRNAIRLNNNTERIRFVPASPPPILFGLPLHRWLILDRPRRREAARFRRQHQRLAPAPCRLRTSPVRFRSLADTRDRAGSNRTTALPKRFPAENRGKRRYGKTLRQLDKPA
jgi:hypothetical protein